MKARQKGKQNKKFKLIAQYTKEARAIVIPQSVIDMYRRWLNTDMDYDQCGVLCGAVK